MSRLKWFHLDTRFGAADWNCDCEDTAAGATEASARPAVAFTRRGIYRRHVGSSNRLIDAGTAVSYPQWMEYRVSHPLPGGDKSTIVSLTGDGLESLGVERLSAEQIASSRGMILLVREVDIAAREGAGLAVEELLVPLMMEAISGLTGNTRHLPKRQATAAAHHGRTPPPSAPRGGLPSGRRGRQPYEARRRNTADRFRPRDPRRHRGFQPSLCGERPGSLLHVHR